MILAEMSFQDAKDEFKSFLSQNGIEGPLLWVFQEDVYSRNTETFVKDFWLKLPLPSSNEELAERHFEVGKAKGFGLGLGAFANCEDGLCCSFIVPADGEDAQYLMMSPEQLKYSLVIELPEAKVVRSNVVWKLLGMLPFLCHGNFMVYLTSKAKLVSSTPDPTT